MTIVEPSSEDEPAPEPGFVMVAPMHRGAVPESVTDNQLYSKPKGTRGKNPRAIGNLETNDSLFEEPSTAGTAPGTRKRSRGETVRSSGQESRGKPHDSERKERDSEDKVSAKKRKSPVTEKPFVQPGPTTAQGAEIADTRGRPGGNATRDST